MAKNITLPIVTIIGSRSIKEVNFDLFIDPTHVSQIISGGAIGVDTLAEQWAKRNHIDFVCYKPNYDLFGRRAPLVRDEEMIKACDIVIAFWDGQSTGTKYTLNYAKKIGRPYIVHEIIERY